MLEDPAVAEAIRALIIAIASAIVAIITYHTRVVAPIEREMLDLLTRFQAYEAEQRPPRRFSAANENHPPRREP